MRARVRSEAARCISIISTWVEFMMKVQSPRDHRRARTLVGNSIRVEIVSRSSEISSINVYRVHIAGYQIIFLTLPIIYRYRSLWQKLMIIYHCKTNYQVLRQTVHRSFSNIILFSIIFAFFFLQSWKTIHILRLRVTHLEIFLVNNHVYPIERNFKSIGKTDR